MSEHLNDNNVDKDNERDKKKTAAAVAATESAQVLTKQAAARYAKPDTYTGNRTLYDSGSAKRQVKETAFKNGKNVVDPYTGNKLVKTQKEAKALYGDDWARHVAESDHIMPLEKIHGENKTNPWLSNKNIKEAANSSDNLKVVSRQFNNAKRNHSNQEIVQNEGYYKDKGIHLTPKGKDAAVRDNEAAQKAVQKQLTKDSVGNFIETGHNAGKNGAAIAGSAVLTMSGIMNLVDVVKGEKDVGEALGDIAADTGKAAADGYVMSSGLTLVSQTLSSSSSEFIRALAESNIPGTVITAVIVTGDTLKRYAGGEITTQECLLELGEKGLNTITVGYSVAIGQELIPIPVVGAAVGALVGYVLTNGVYRERINTLKTKELEHQERLRIIAECEQTAAQTKAFREELESYLAAYFKDYQDCFDDALSEIRSSLQMGNTDGIVAGANKITRKLGGKVYYETDEAFKAFLDDDILVVL